MGMGKWAIGIIGILLAMALVYQAGVHADAASQYTQQATQQYPQLEATKQDCSSQAVATIADLQKSIVKVTAGTEEGSGVILKQENGITYILTNRHVIAESKLEEINILLSNTQQLKPNKIRIAPNGMDFAILEVKGTYGTPAKIADHDLQQGEDVLVLGSPRGIQNSVSKGIISNFGTDETKQGYLYHTIQQDGAMNPGNSGGGLFLLSTGELIGINTFKYPNMEGLNFAIDIKELGKLGNYESWNTN